MKRKMTIERAFWITALTLGVVLAGFAFYRFLEWVLGGHP